MDDHCQLLRHLLESCCSAYCYALRGANETGTFRFLGSVDLYAFPPSSGLHFLFRIVSKEFVFVAFPLVVYAGSVLSPNMTRHEPC